MNRNQGDLLSAKLAMDSRKFLSVINSSHQSKIVFFENLIKKLGKKHDQKWSLTALLSDKVIFEDGNNNYFIATHDRKKGGRVVIDNIKKLSITEGQKSDVFSDACLELVEAIESEDNSLCESVFGKLSASKYRSTSVPYHGYVKTKDGMIRKIVFENESDISDGIEIIKEYVNKNARISGGKILLEDKEISPITKMDIKKHLAYRMKNVAEEAFWNENFQKFAGKVAGLVCEDKVKSAVNVAGKFLHEYQEFCMLNKDEFRELTSNALAAVGCLNEALVRDVATLLYRTNLKCNQKDITEAWRKAATIANDPIVLESVQNVEESENFEGAYETFLKTIFEASDVERDAIKNSLINLKESLPEYEDKAIEAIDRVLDKFESTGADDATLAEARQILAEISPFASRDDNIEDFDDIPALDDEEDALEDEPDLDLIDDEEAEPDKDKGNTTNIDITINTGDTQPDVDLDKDGEQDDADKVEDDMDFAALEDLMGKEEDSIEDLEEPEDNTLGFNESKEYTLEDLDQIEAKINREYQTIKEMSSIGDVKKTKEEIEEMEEELDKKKEEVIEKTSEAIMDDEIDEKDKEKLKDMLEEGMFKEDLDIQLDKVDDKLVAQYKDSKILIDGNTNKIFSEDKSLESSVPEEHIDAFKYLIGEGEKKDISQLVEWLDSQVDYFADEQAQLDEAVATVIANSDGSMEVNVDNDPDSLTGSASMVEPDTLGIVGSMPEDEFGMDDLSDLSDIPDDEVVGEVPEEPVDLPTDEEEVVVDLDVEADVEAEEEE